MHRIENHVQETGTLMMRILLIYIIQLILIIENLKSCARDRYSDDEDSNDLAIDTNN